MEEMNRSECFDFLRSGTKTAHVATTRADGSPHVVPVWIDVDGEIIIFSTGADSVKARNLKRKGRICISMDDPHPPYSFVKIEGTVSFSEDLDEMLYWTTRIGGRYMGEENAEIFGKRNAVPGEILVKVNPEKITAWKDVAGW